MMEHKRSMSTHWKKRHIMEIDIVVMLFFVLAIAGMIIGYTQRDNSNKVFAVDVASKDELSGSSLSGTSKGKSGMARYSTSTTSQAGNDNASTSQDEFLLPESHSSTSSTSSESESRQNVSKDEKLRFKDVTAVAYQNLRLGFVMELPANWRLMYEHSDEVLFVSDTVSLGTSLDDVRHTPKAMWISVGQVCQSADATSTPFALLYASTTPTRERYACIPPLKINMGVRRDQTNTSQQQSFLLDIARTIYPIVRPGS